MAITTNDIQRLAYECGFELVGVTPALPLNDFGRFKRWRRDGLAGEMGYLTDHRGDLRSDPRHLLAAAASMICVGKLYNTAQPHTQSESGDGWISRYAWGSDYHIVVREGLLKVVERLRDAIDEPFEWRICVDTAPLLERSYARAAGLGWIGKNTCLINQEQGSWFFLGELPVSVPLPRSAPVPDRCGTCTRCIDACPTAALIPDDSGRWQLDARRCISYLTIEKRGPVAPEMAAQVGNHIFGCDICQDVCPWNRRAAFAEDDRFSPLDTPRDLPTLAGLTSEQFNALFRQSPVSRAKYEGFLRNVAIAMGNSARPEMLAPLMTMSSHPNRVVAQAAKAALCEFDERFGSPLRH